MTANQAVGQFVRATNGSFHTNVGPLCEINCRASVRAHVLFFEPWVQKILIRLWGKDLIGYAVRVKNCPSASVYSPGKVRTQSEMRLAAKPERGIFRSGFDAAYIVPAAGARRTCLVKADAGLDYYATSGLRSSIITPALWQWGHDANGDVFEYRAGGWILIKAGASPVTPADFQNY
jgi:hypothetical protein